MPKSTKPATEFYLVRGSDSIVVTTPAEAVALEYQGWVHAERPAKPKPAPPSQS